MRLEFDRASPSRSEGKPVVKSLKDRSSGPVSMIEACGRDGLEESLLRIIERTAWVPHAFWIVWEAKKRLCSSMAVGAKVPS